jgi:hypothetical protein
MNVLHGSFHSTTLTHLGINVCLVSRATSIGFGETCEHSVLHLPCPAPLTVYPADCVFSPMAPVVHIEPNGIQTLLLLDNAHEDLENKGWLVFIQKFEGFNLAVAQQFSLTFDGCRGKVGDIQLNLNEEFLSSATGLPAKGKRWFKNSKVDKVPWSLLFTSRKIVSCHRGMPITTLKSRGHDLLAIVKKFMTCEGHYGLVFLYHLQLLMNFIDFPLNIPHYLLHILYKMSKRFKREKADSSLFHHYLIKIIIVYHLRLSGDYWQALLLRNGFATTECIQVDKVVVTETLVGPVVPPPTLLPTCWQPIHILHYLISCLHQCFTNIDFPSQISNERLPYSLRLFHRLYSLNLRNCKHENFAFQGHILNHYLNCRYLLYHHAYCACLLLIFT